LVRIPEAPPHPQGLGDGTGTVACYIVGHGKSDGAAREMKRHTLTLSLPEATLCRARQIAVERGPSLSELVAGQLEELVRKDRDYQRAHRRALAMMRRGIPMGVGGTLSWTRDHLHQR
jgi:hypothetical protein